MYPMRVRVIANPAAGLRTADLRGLVALVRHRGASADLHLTERPGHATELARDAAARRFDAVLACGGDGTLNEAANGLVATATALLAVPAGTANVWAKEVGISRRPEEAAALLWDGQVRQIDLGRAGERYFLLMAGIGFDATVTQQVSFQEKRRLGQLAYMLRGAATFLTWHRRRMRLVIDGKVLRRRPIFVLIGNTRLYGGLVTITHQAVADDGLLDVCIFSGKGLLSKVKHFARVFLRRHTDSPQVEYYRARRIAVWSRPRQPIQLDGDPVAVTPVTFECVPGALRVIVPPDLPAGLFSRDGRLAATG